MSIKISIAQRIASAAVLASFLFTNAFAVSTFRNDTIRVAANSPALAKYTTDLTQLGREGRLRENLKFEGETLHLANVLAEGGRRQPVIIDETKEAQNAIVEQLAIRIAKGSVPTNLAGKSILKLETAVLFSNARTSADAAQAIDSLVNEVVASKGQIILYVDELTNLVGSNASSTRLFDSVAAGKLIVIGGSSAAAYGERIESQPEIAAFFAGILVTDRSNAVAETDTGKREEKSEFRGDNVSPDLREMMAQDPSGKKRVDVILQAKDAENAALRSILDDGHARIS